MATTAKGLFSYIDQAQGSKEVTHNASLDSLEQMLMGVTNKTGNYTLVLADHNGVFTNLGAGGTVIFSLPSTIVVGMRFSFFVSAAFILRVQAGSGHTLRVNSALSASTGKVEGSTIGMTIVFRATSSTQWVAEFAPNGTWTVT